MKLQMNKFVKIWIIFALLLVVALFADYLASSRFGSSPISIFDSRPVPFNRITTGKNYTYVGDIELYYKVQTIFSSINATLLIFLLAEYVDMYLKLKSEFTLGLIVFSLTLLLYALTSNPLIQWIFGYYAFGLGPFAMIPELFTTLSLVILLYLTLK
ncbi:MAG: hypothetical protein NUK63_04715 [Candidatus Bathyarchaeum tardum]|nr:MAG: hypothetical protein NUK63_04715 [Candidatus Bathyarchaeum tardum]